MAQQVCAVFDIGKTNKKFFLFDQDLNEVSHQYTHFREVPDDDGFLSDDLGSLVHWMKKCVDELVSNEHYDLKSINFSTYGASLVNLDANGEVITPFYNYLKPVDNVLQREFIDLYGPEDQFSADSASPVMGLLNSGFQLFYLKRRKPKLFSKIATSLHLPQYLSFIFTGRKVADYTSIGCHTALWDFANHNYHSWVKSEDLLGLMPDPVESATSYPVEIGGKIINVGVGVHDSSSALVPYINTNTEPFVLISTGTWSICMNFFNESKLTIDEFKQDCLNFFGIKGTYVKASRLFLGKHFSEQTEKLSEFFGTPQDEFKDIKWSDEFMDKRTDEQQLLFDHSLLAPERFGFKNCWEPDFSAFESYEEAYFQLMYELTDLQIASLKLAMGTSSISKVFIDGGFSANHVFVQLMANKLRDCKIYSSSFALGTALGAALLVNYRTLPERFLSDNYQMKEHKPSR